MPQPKAKTQLGTILVSKTGQSADIAPGQIPTQADVASCCPFQESIDLLGRRHAMTIIWLLHQEEPRRFNQIKRILAINPVSLSQRLDDLEAAGVVARRTFNSVPPKVEYRLTAKGRDLLPLLDQLSAWSKKHQDRDSTTSP